MNTKFFPTIKSTILASIFATIICFSFSSCNNRKNNINEKDNLKEESNYEYFTDNRDGNKYKIANFNGVTWMIENLRYLPEVNPPTEGSENNDGRSYYYVYGYEGSNIEEAKQTPNYSKHGVLYNLNAAKENKDDYAGICPKGWHIPSKEDFIDLTSALSDNEWKCNDGTTKKEFFNQDSGTRGGKAGADIFCDINIAGFWWTRSINSYGDPILFYFDCHEQYCGPDESSNYNGLSIRCVKNGEGH